MSAVFPPSDTLDDTVQQDEIDANTAGVASNTAAIGALNTRLTTAEGDITGNDADIAALDTRLTTAEGNITGNDTDIAALDTRLTTAEGNITGNDTDIAALDTRLTTAEGNIADLGSTDSFYETLVATTYGVPTRFIATPLHQLITRLWASGLWAAADAVYVMGTDSETRAYYNLKDPGTLDLAKVGSPSWRFYRDLSLDGSSSALNPLGASQFPSGLSLYAQDNAHVCCFVNSLPGTGTASYILGTSGATSNSAHRLYWDSSNNLQVSLNSTTAGTAVSGISASGSTPHPKNGFFSLTRNAAGSLSVHTSKVSNTTVTQTSASLSTVDLTMFKDTATPLWTSGQALFYSIGGYLNTAQIRLVRSAVTNYFLQTGTLEFHSQLLL